MNPKIEIYKQGFFWYRVEVKNESNKQIGFVLPTTVDAMYRNDLTRKSRQTFTLRGAKRKAQKLLNEYSPKEKEEPIFTIQRKG